MKIAVIGAGAMGGALAEGLLRAGQHEIFVSNRSEGRLQPLAALGASVTTDNRVAASGAEVIIIAVKPWLVASVLGAIDTAGKTVVSLAAGVSSEALAALAPEADIWLAIPNIAASLRASMTFLVAARTSGRADVKALFDGVGTTLLCDEQHLAAGTTLASCGIAYALRYIRAAAEGGVELGFRADEAQRIVAQTVLGAASLLQATGLHAEALIDQVTTPGGLTIRGLNAMEQAGFSPAVISGLKAAVK